MGPRGCGCTWGHVGVGVWGHVGVGVWGHVGVGVWGERAKQRGVRVHRAAAREGSQIRGSMRGFASNGGHGRW